MLAACREAMRSTTAKNRPLRHCSRHSARKDRARPGCGTDLPPHRPANQKGPYASCGRAHNLTMAPPSGRARPSEHGYRGNPRTFGGERESSLAIRRQLRQSRAADKATPRNSARLRNSLLIV